MATFIPTDQITFQWNDGGRAASGFVGVTGDCATRSLAIVTGRSYRDVYQDLWDRQQRTPRRGVYVDAVNQFLRDNGWKRQELDVEGGLPQGIVVLSFADHVSALIDGVVHDTWNPLEDADRSLQGCWVHPGTDSKAPIPAPLRQSPTTDADLNQKQFEKIVQRIKALKATATNHASTEGEIRNAMQMMQSLLIRHNLERNDILEDDDVSQVGMTRMACPLNGRNACQWEWSLAHYVTMHIFPMVQFYGHTGRGHRRLFWFYGPRQDVEQTIGVFRELLITIATQCRVGGFGTHTRGSGASYCEGFVEGLPSSWAEESADDDQAVSARNLIRARQLAIHDSATEWLKEECGVRLSRVSGVGRSSFDRSAHRRGQADGAKHDVRVNSRKRISG